jgi:hypothetical protein
MSQYQYTKSANLETLQSEIQSSSIVTALDNLTSLGSTITIVFKTTLSNTDETTLDSIVENHVNIPTIDNEISVKINQPKDADDAIIIRPKAAKTGWTYFLNPVEFTTAKLNSIHSKKHDGSNRTNTTYKIYDSNDVEITAVQDELNAVKTIVDFEPLYDYEIIGGQLQQHTKPNTNIRLWVIAVPDVPENSGGSKEMVGGVNLKFIDPADKVSADGRVSKYMTYNATYHTNKLRLILKHDAGIQHDVMMVFEMFKA